MHKEKKRISPTYLNGLYAGLGVFFGLSLIGGSSNQ